jgi:threonine synthase
MLHCADCGAPHLETLARWRCDCGGPLSLPLGPGLTRAAVCAGEPSFWRYAAALPVRPDARGVYFGEGMTPLVPRRWGGRRVDFKLDFLFPSGSFKDRGAAVLINALAQRGVEQVHADSSGNAGAAIATYAGAAGIGCTVYVPAGNSVGKRVQIAACGARVVEVEGPREASFRAAARAADEGSVYASHNWNPLFAEGLKTVAFELWEQYGFQAPDVILAPAGYGGIVLALDRAFQELLRAGAVDRLPRVYGCQSANCAPLHRAALAGDPARAALDLSETLPTVAEGIASTRPVRAREVLEGLARGGGRVVAVAEERIVEAWALLARQGLYVEPTSAVAPAAALELLESGEVPRDARVAILLTGSGLKATERVAAFSRPAERPPLATPA